MRILIVTPHFYPENFKCNDMAFELVRRGHKVSVMTAIPDYPQGHYYDGYGIFKKRYEVIKGVNIYRSMIIPRGSGSSFRLILNYLSYTFFSALQSLRLGLFHRYDAIIVHEPSPVLVGIPAVIVKKLQKIPLYFWVLDLWPESLAAAGGIRNKAILGVFGHLTKWLYKNSDKILISSKGFRESISKKGNFGNKIIFFPNWIDPALSAFTGCEDQNISLPQGFLVMYAGNIGDAQDLYSVMHAADLLRDQLHIHFILLGDGRKKEWVENYILDHDLKNTVHCLGRFPIEMMQSFFKKADILFLSLKDTEIFRLTIPARLQAYMSAGKPIVAMLNGEGADLIDEAQCGYHVAAGDSKGLVNLLLDLSTIDKTILQEKGLNGWKYSQKHYTFCSCMDHLQTILGAS